MVSYSRALEHKRVMNNLATLVTADSLGAMAVARSDEVRVVAESLRRSAPVILDQYGRISGLLSQQYYMDVRSSAGVKSKFTPTIATLNIAASTDEAVGFTISRLVAGTPFDTAASIFSGAIGRSVLSVDRNTVVNNATSEGSEYRRIASPGGCSFCLYAATVADVVTEQFDGYHDHCQCTTVPLFDTRLQDEPEFYDQFRNEAGDARQRLIDLQNEQRPIWEAEKRAAGVTRLTNRAFLAQNPDLSINTRNVLREIRTIRGSR